MSHILIVHADSYEYLQAHAKGQIRSICTDPPYEISFMGQDWDATGVAFDVKFWRLCHDVLADGGDLRVFCYSKNYFLVAHAIRKAGFEVEKILPWIYSENMPKNTNISKQFDRKAGAKRKVVGYQRGVGGENLNDIVRGAKIRSTEDPGAKGIGAYGVGAKQVSKQIPVTAPATREAKQWASWGTGLKLAYEAIICARKTSCPTPSP